MSLKTAGLTVPILPHTSPEADQPQGMKLPLHPHQLRALNRCLVIEQDGSLGSGFGGRFDYKSRGGVLADAVGTGKTATSIGLVLAGQVENGGDTLVVAPAHLIPQWKAEIQKFASPSSLEVIVGQQEFDQKCGGASESSKRRIVLVDVDTVLNEDKLWYDYGDVYSDEGKCRRLKVSPDRLAQYKLAGRVNVKSPMGPCGYEGWIYTGSLHIPKRPWRRVIFDEIQDLVSKGTSSQKNLLQLSRTAVHVWLLTATPFPHGNSSVYANHELLGFCRLKMDVEVSQPLPKHHSFELIKRKLYIRSPPHVADEAVHAKQKVQRQVIQVQQLNLEQRFYQLELGRLASGGRGDKFDSEFYPLREMTVHPEASKELREQMLGASQRYTSGPGSKSVGATASLAVREARRRLREIEATNLEKSFKECVAISNSLTLVEKVIKHREGPVAANPFAVKSGDMAQHQTKEERIIHDHYCGCTEGAGSTGCYADKHVHFRVIRERDSREPAFIKGSLERLVYYFRQDLNAHRFVASGTGQVAAINSYKSHTTRALDMRREMLANLEKEKKDLKLQIETLNVSKEESILISKQERNVLAQAHGSKPASLIQFLTKVVENGERAIVFSYWHDTLKLVGKTLTKCGLPSVFCGGTGDDMSRALGAFTSGDVSIILLSAASKASGANLQCATHVVLLDPAGSSAEHGSALEEQAIGRAVRMGQEHPVQVTRFCVMGTLEAELFDEIDTAANKAKARASNSSYVIQDADKFIPVNKRTCALNDSKKDDDEEIEMTQAISGEERLRQELKKAEDNGEVITISEDSDDEQETDVLDAPNAPSVVKCEPTATKRGVPGEGESPELKRTRLEEKTLFLATPKSPMGRRQ